MPNYINGSRLKKYNLPLTTDMLERMHAEKERKQQVQKTIQQAQEEARIRKQKLRERQSSHVTKEEENKRRRCNQIIPIHGPDYSKDANIEVYVGNKKVRATPLVDSGSNVDLISFELFQQLQDEEIHPKFNGWKSYTG